MSEPGETTIAIRQVEVFRFTVPLAGPLVFKEKTLHQREGWLLRATADGGEIGWGEVAPLPGFSRESQAEVEQALVRLQDLVREKKACLISLSKRDVKEIKLPASVRFGWEMAVWECLATRSGRVLPAVLAGDFAPTLSLNGLLMGSAAEVLERATALVNAGYTTLKLKVGRLALHDEIALVHELRAGVGASVQLRLDANRAWSLDEACAFAEKVGAAQIAYIEEPVADPEALEAFCKETGLPVALDETLVEPSFSSLADYPFVQAVVLKPTLIGGVAATRRLVQQADERGITPVFSAAFETGVGLRALAALAAAWGNPATAAGLDTYRWLAADVLQPRLDVRGPEIDVRALFATAHLINEAVLQPWAPA